ncbi:MAG: HRDC domain-containing protein, partial [Armatimonadetes bacterium]|nr:HRDC domain-containing protein [Armatimonadota bacterium]
DGPLQVDVVVPDMTAAQIDEENERNRLRRRIREHQLLAMCSYAETPRSRRLVLLKYFGDPTQPTADELARDDPTPPPPDPAQVTPEETEVARRILETVQTARYAVGRQKLVQVVKGSGSSKLDPHLKRLPTFGTLKAFATDHLTAAVDDLVRQGYLRPTGGEFPVLALGEAGKAVLEDPRALVACESLRSTAPVLAGERPGKRVDVEAVAFNELTPAEAELFERLRRWRAEKSREYGIAPFMVLSDRTLRAICRARPVSASDLLTIPGIGPQKADGYGREVLELIERWQGEHPDADLTPPDPPQAAPARPAPQAPPTAEVKLTESALATLALLDEGLDVPAVAERRQVQAAVVSNDVNALIAAGRLTPERLLGADLAERIRGVLEARPGITLAEARGELGPDAGYSAIRWVRQWLEAQRPRPEPEPPAEPLGIELLPGPWEAGWRVAAGGADELLAAIAVVLDPRKLALAAVVGGDPVDERLAREISRRVGVPVSHGLFGADGGLLARERLAEPLLLAGPEAALHTAAATACEAGVRRILAVCHTGPAARRR